MVAKKYERRGIHHGPMRSSKSYSDRSSPYYDHKHRSTVGSVLNRRYEILGHVGEGTTAKVFHAYDKYTQSAVIIKVEKHKDYAYVMQEIQILTTICSTYTDDDIPIIRLLDWFEEDIGICLVFEKGSTSLWDFMQQRRDARFCLKDIQAFGRQILHAVARFHRLHITHADFKPENLVFVPKRGYKEVSESRKETNYQKHGACHSDRSSHSSSSSRRLHNHESDEMCLKVIDFGLSVFDHSHHPLVIGTRAYSPPETVLETPWSQPLDIWGVACILMEMYIGYTLFQCSEDDEQVALWEKTLGPIPGYLVDKANGEKRDWFFDTLDHLPTSRNIQHQKRLSELIHPYDEDFYDLISSMLCYDPQQRITAEEALHHPFFTSSQSCTCGCEDSYVGCD